MRLAVAHNWVDPHSTVTATGPLQVSFSISSYVRNAQVAPALWPRLVQAHFHSYYMFNPVYLWPPSSRAWCWCKNALGSATVQPYGVDFILFESGATFHATAAPVVREEQAGVYHEGRRWEHSHCNTIHAHRSLRIAPTVLEFLAQRQEKLEL